MTMLSEDKVEAAVERAMAKAFENAGCRLTCPLDTASHREDHEFVCNVRDSLKEGRRTLVQTLVKTLTWGLIVAVAAYFGIKGIGIK